MPYGTAVCFWIWKVRMYNVLEIKDYRNYQKCVFASERGGNFEDPNRLRGRGRGGVVDTSEWEERVDVADPGV